MSLAYSMVIDNFQNFLENFQIFKQFQPFISNNNVNLILFSWKIFDGNVFFTNKNKRIYISFNFYSKIRKLLKFVIFQKLVKIEIFNKKQKKIGHFTVYFQKSLNPQIVENKEIHRNLYKNRSVKLMWFFSFCMWHLTLTTKLSEFVKCNMVILKNDNFRRINKSGFRPFWK